MKTKTDQPKSPEPKSNAKDDLKTIPLAEVEKKLEFISRWTHSSRGRKTVDAIWA